MPDLDPLIQGLLGPVADVINKVVMLPVPIGDVKVPLILVWMLAGGIVFTIVLKALPWRSAGTTVAVVQGRYTRRSDPGILTSLQALMTDLGGAVGLGNIGGVAIAITIGGPGAVIWIMIGGLLGMATKAAEATLGVRYRQERADGTLSGGPMYYLQHGLGERGLPRLGRGLAIVYALCAAAGTIGAGAVFQANQTAAAIVTSTGGDDSFFSGRGWIIGVVLAIGAGMTIIGGIGWIGRVSSVLVTIMAVGYLACCAIIIVIGAQGIPQAAGEIVSGAFTGRAAAGGAVGALLIGIQRAFFSNGAGNGNSATAHSSVKTSRPGTEGFVAMWGPFVDSVIVCTATALAIVISGVWRTSSSDGVALTSEAFATVHPLFSHLLTIAVLLFAFSTMLAHSFYGKKALGYLFGNSRIAEIVYSLIFLLMVVAGSASSLEAATGLADSLLFLMSVPNLIGLYLLARVAKKEIVGFREGTRSGEIPEVPVDERFGGLSPSGTVRSGRTGRAEP